MFCSKEVPTMKSLRYYVPGILLILLAMVIVAVPEIIIGFIAASIIVAGMGALYIGHKIRKSEIEFGVIL
jgi:hypothetical protein